MIFATALVGVTTSGVAAQEAAANASAGADVATPEPEAPEQVSSTLKMHDARYDADRGAVVVVLEASEAQAVTVAGLTAMRERGEIPTRSVALKPGERVTVTVPTEKVNGWVGVSISTPDVLFGVPIEVEGSLIGGPWSSQDAQIAGAAGLLSGLMLVTGLAWRRVSNTSKDAERLL